MKLRSSEPSLISEESAPRLRFEALLPTLILPRTSAGPRFGIFCNRQFLLNELKLAGFESLIIDPPFSISAKRIQASGLNAHISYQYQRMGKTKTLTELIPDWIDSGFGYANLFVGHGFETLDEAKRTTEAALNQAAKFNFQIFIETHRGCVTQDVQRTLALVNEFPEIRFTSDFSHWIVTNAINEERVDRFIDVIDPVIKRTGLLQARVASVREIQVPKVAGTAALAVNLKIWASVFESFLRKAKAGDVLPFAPEVLPPLFSYGIHTRDSHGRYKEPVDRWQEMILICEKAKQAFDSLLAARDSKLARPADQNLVAS